MTVPAHDQKLTVRLVEHIPPHGPRGKAFEAAKRRMKELGLYYCVIQGCDTGAQLEAHHSIVEHAWQGGVTVAKLNKEFGLHLADDEFAAWVQSPGNLEILCLHGDVPVLMASGDERPISELRPGDLVVGGDGRAHSVTATVAKPYDGDLLVRGDLVLTPGHRVATSAGWIPAGASSDARGFGVLCLQVGGVGVIQDQVLDAVVGPVPVDVVDTLSPRQASTDVLLHDVPMLHDETAIDSHADVAAGGRRVFDQLGAFAPRQFIEGCQSTLVRAESPPVTDAPTPESKRRSASLAYEVVPDDAFWTGARVVSHIGSIHDIEVSGSHSFVAAGTVVHNCSVHHRTQLGIHALPEPLWNLVRIWRDDMPPPAEHVTG